MKFFLLLSLFLASVPARASRMEWLDRTCRGDACLHFATAYGLGLTGAELLYKKAHLSPLESTLYSAGAVLLLGAFKEGVLDSSWDGRDMAANILGAGVGVGMFYLIEF